MGVSVRFLVVVGVRVLVAAEVTIGVLVPAVASFRAVLV
jgi:hypothetical protein